MSAVLSIWIRPPLKLEIQFLLKPSKNSRKLNLISTHEYNSSLIIIKQFYILIFQQTLIKMLEGIKYNNLVYHITNY